MDERPLQFIRYRKNLLYLDLDEYDKRIAYMLRYYGVDYRIKLLIDDIYGESAKYIKPYIPFNHLLQFNMGYNIYQGSKIRCRAIVSKYNNDNEKLPFCFDENINGRLLMLHEDDESVSILLYILDRRFERLMIENELFRYRVEHLV